MAQRVFVFTSGEYSDYSVDFATADKRAALKYAKECGHLSLSEMLGKGDLLVWGKDGKELVRRADNRWGFYAVNMWADGECRAERIADNDGQRKILIQLNKRSVKNPEWQKIPVGEVKPKDWFYAGPDGLGQPIYRWVEEYQPQLTVTGRFRSAEVAKLFADEVRCDMLHNGTWEKAAAEIGQDPAIRVHISVKVL